VAGIGPHLDEAGRFQRIDLNLDVLARGVSPPGDGGDRLRAGHFNELEDRAAGGGNAGIGMKGFPDCGHAAGSHADFPDKSAERSRIRHDRLVVMTEVRVSIEVVVEASEAQKQGKASLGFPNRRLPVQVLAIRRHRKAMREPPVFLSRDHGGIHC
jgi:hypothetical protein